ncbi:hypothetical protein Taro_038724 [Colocasia esculenta]|uniref:Exopolygalacturonase n=1 Tax=Colocasia esculenta TaxID=4460 RepID=A0A843WGP1_COLES|nr:hypothetical protein [Colocasia esculenta]
MTGCRFAVWSACLPLLFFCVFPSNAHRHPQRPKVFDVEAFGAVVDGEADHNAQHHIYYDGHGINFCLFNLEKLVPAQAFLCAWRAACASKAGSRMVIPEGRFLVNPLAFTGPCNGSVEIQVLGTVLAPADLGVFPAGKAEWIAFNYIESLVIRGGGTFDGQGASAWPDNDCSKKNATTCHKIPNSIGFNFVKSLIITQITSLNSKKVHMNIFSCQNVTLKGITITAPGDSPNTDGIHISGSSNVKIDEASIGTGDDCISIGPGTRNLFITGVSCGPGHGISIGSLGGRPKEKDVLGITVSNSSFHGTQNGVRIKTWPASYALSASNFTFQDIVMDYVKNPVFIDQNYCPRGQCDHEFPSRVKISQVLFKNIIGTSASKVAINLSCSESVPCEDVELNDIDLVYLKKGKARMASSSCSNVNGGRSVGHVNPPPCI